MSPNLETTKCSFSDFQNLYHFQLLKLVKRLWILISAKSFFNLKAEEINYIFLSLERFKLLQMCIFFLVYSSRKQCTMKLPTFFNSFSLKKPKNKQ